MANFWQPSSETDILDAIRSGVIAESHYLEVKEQARNEQIAQTLASFAIDGGMFILGIAEVKDDKGTKKLVPKPVALEGILERIDGISRNAIEPPLPVTTSVIGAGDGSGYVVVTVEPSPLAPHMAGHKYYGRGDASKHALSDAEVLRHHQRRQEQIDLGMKLLDQAEASDPVAPGERQHGHIYFVAEPLMRVNSELVQQFLDDHQALVSFVMSGQGKCRENLASFYPTPSDAYRTRHREFGVSVLNGDADYAGHTPKPPVYSEASILDVEILESGGVRILIGRGTDKTNSDETVVCDGLAVAYAQRLAFWIAALSERFQYRSLWALGLRINGVKGLQSHIAADNWRTTSMPTRTMQTNVYSCTLTISTASLSTSPDAAVESLVGRLLRILGTREQHLGNRH